MAKLNGSRSVRHHHRSRIELPVAEYKGRGTVMAVGGKEDRSGAQVILKEFVKLARGPEARVLVMTVPTDHPEASAEEYVDIFKALGVKTVQWLDISDRIQAQSDKSVALVEHSTGVWFTGGRQLYVTSLLGGSLLHGALVALVGRGGIIAGTSAGATMLSNSMIINGKADAASKVGNVEMAPGMDFLPGTIIDTHFAQRGRHGRLLTAVAHYPQDLGLGIDEDTAFVAEKGIIRVIGSGAVTVIDAAQVSMTNLPGLAQGDNIALHHVLVYVLPQGFRFNLGTRLPASEVVSDGHGNNGVVGNGRPGKPAKRRRHAGKSS